MAKRVVLYEPPIKINTNTDRDAYQRLFSIPIEDDVTEKPTTYRILGNVAFKNKNTHRKGEDGDQKISAQAQ
jgi:hypothetical protein